MSDEHKETIQEIMEFTEHLQRQASRLFATRRLTMDWNEKTELVKEFVDRFLFGKSQEYKEEYLFEVLHKDYMKLSEEDLIREIEYNGYSVQELLEN